MAEEDTLAKVLSDLARTLITDFPIQAILDHLVDRIVDVLPVTAAGVTLINAGREPRYVAASDDLALSFERLQAEFGEGPCLTAYETGAAVAVSDLRIDNRFPRFGPAAVSAGLVAVFTFPLRHGESRIGALDLYRNTPGDMDARNMDVAQTLADVVSAYLLNAEAREEARSASVRFQHSALHDPLTGLPNRQLLQERLAHAAQRAQRSHTTAAVLFIDLDKFKRVNDNYGHQSGDHLLLGVAERLAKLVRPGDTLARFSGDEFVLLCEDLRSTSDAEALARRIGEALADPFLLDLTEVTITASVGLAFAGPGENVSEATLANADSAMYQAKRRGGSGHQVFDLRESRREKDRNVMELELRSALAKDELAVAYQPIVRCTDGVIIGVEALLRWTPPDRGPVSPLSMVALAERSSLINDIGAWILARSCRDRGRWLSKHPDAPLDLSVNVSVRQLMSHDFYETCTHVLDSVGMDPTALILEITENIFIDDSERAMAVLRALKKRGIRIALDDFGTGYSSLIRLRRFPIDIVKIDRSFIADIGHRQGDAPIVAAVTNMAHALDLTVTAEGVETRNQGEVVNAIGCESAQGYFFGRPVPSHAIDSRLGAPTLTGA